MDIAMTRPATGSGLKQVYERMRPMIVWLGLTELAWIAFWLLAAEDSSTGFRATVTTWIVLVLAWMSMIIYLGTRDFFLKHTRSFSNLVGVVLLVALTVVWFSSTSIAWEGLVTAAGSMTDLQLAAIHILRLLAIGTVIKYFQKQLPLNFVIFGSLPDFLFATSAVVVTILAAIGPVGHSFLVTWHVIGFCVFLGAGVSMFFTVPSALRRCIIRSRTRRLPFSSRCCWRRTSLFRCS